MCFHFFKIIFLIIYIIYNSQTRTFTILTLNSSKNIHFESLILCISYITTQDHFINTTVV